MRSAGNIWKKLKEQRKASDKERGQGLEREGFGKLGRNVGKGRGDSLLHRNLPFRVELHLELHQAGGAESSLSSSGAGTLSPEG